MAEFLFLMHALPDGVAEGDWSPWLDKLERSGHLRGGSEIGGGKACCKHGKPNALTHHINGFVRIEAKDMKEAEMLLAGNPVFEAGGTIEIRDLPFSE